MNLKSRVAAIQTAFGESAAARSSPEVKTAAWALLYFIGGFIMSAARILEIGAPFGVAAVAAAGGGINGAACLAGAALGYIATGGIAWGIHYVAACVIAYTACFAFQDTKVSRRAAFAPVTAAIVIAATGFLAGFADIVEGKNAAALLALETLLGSGACLFFREAMAEPDGTTENAELRHTGAVMITAAVMLMSAARAEVFGVVSIGHVLALLAVMTGAERAGMSAGCILGVCFGAAMDIAGGQTPFFTMAYAVSGLIAGLCRKRGRLLFVLAFVLADAAAAACIWSVQPQFSALSEAFAASVIFMLLPSGVTGKLGALMQTGFRGSGESGLRRYVSKRIYGLSQAYSGLYEIVRRNVEQPHNDEDPSRVFDRAADAVCVACRDKNRCWNREYMDTLAAMNDALGAMEKRGMLMLEDIPARFAGKCRTPEAFVAAVNGELRAAAYRKRFAAQLRESRDTAWGQYADMAQILCAVADELGGANGADHLAERRLIRYLRTLDIDADTAVYRDGSGRLRCVIESGNLAPLTGAEDYLDKLSAVLGMRLCRTKSDAECTGKLTLMEAEPLAVSVGIAAMKKKGEKVSGDRGTYFKTDSGVLCVILSDGMGCGDNAAKESGEVIEILEKFLRSGIDPAVAMKMLNSVMLLRRGDNWGFATVDLMCVDLFSGETGFYKYGAAPSYVKNGKNIRRIRCSSFAPGLENTNGGLPDIVRLHLKPGSTAIIASDGVIADSNDQWLRSLMSEAAEDMKSLARDTLREAGRQNGESDDMTVLAIRVEARA